MTKPWLEQWTVIKAPHPTIIGGPWVHAVEATGITYHVSPEHADLIAAAPQLVRALLRLEWSLRTAVMNDDETSARVVRVCPQCRSADERRVHHRQCSLDAALTAAGLTTQEERDAAREEIATARS